MTTITGGEGSTPAPSPRLRRFVFHGTSFLRLFTANPATLEGFHRLVENPLPEDATYVRLYNDFEGRIIIVVHSATFSPVPDGDIIPEIPAPTFEMVRAAEGLLT